MMFKHEILLVIGMKTALPAPAWSRRQLLAYSPNNVNQLLA
jgi:hypothetical protein